MPSANRTPSVNRRGRGARRTPANPTTNCLKNSNPDRTGSWPTANAILEQGRKAIRTTDQHIDRLVRRGPDPSRRGRRRASDHSVCGKEGPPGEDCDYWAGGGGIPERGRLMPLASGRIIAAAALQARRSTLQVDFSDAKPQQARLRRRVGPRQVSSWSAAVGRRAGIAKRVTSHMFRHSFAIRLLAGRLRHPHGPETARPRRRSNDDDLNKSLAPVRSRRQQPGRCSGSPARRVLG